MIFKKESIKMFKMFSKIIISISRNLCDDLLYVETYRRTQDKNPLFLFTQVLYSFKNSLSMHFNTATLETIFKPDYSSIIKKPSYPRLILILSSQENSEAEISSNRFKYVTPEFKEAEAPFLNQPGLASPLGEEGCKNRSFLFLSRIARKNNLQRIARGRQR